MTPERTLRLHLASFVVVIVAAILALASVGTIQDYTTAREYPQRTCSPVGPSVFQYHITAVVQEKYMHDYRPVEGASVRLEYEVYDAINEQGDNCSIEPEIVYSETLTTNADGRALHITPSLVWDDQNEKVSIRATATSPGLTTHSVSEYIGYSNRSNTSRALNLVIVNQIWEEE